MPTELELLQKIAENTSSNTSMHIALVAGGSAVAGALASALLSYFGIVRTVRAQTLIERQKLQATVVTTERLRWLQDLRAKVAAFYAQIEMQLSHLERPVGAIQAAKYQETLDALSMEVMSQCYASFQCLTQQKRTNANCAQHWMLRSPSLERVSLRRPTKRCGLIWRHSPN